MPESEPQKHGVTALGCRFSEQANHVPIKKRRFMIRSPSPPPVIASETVDETVVLTNSEEISNRNVTLKSDACEINSNPNIDNNISVGDKKSDKSYGKFGEDEDFSGISILAAAACSSSVGREYGYAEHGTVVEVSSALHKACEVSTNTKARPTSEELLKEDLLRYSEMSTRGTLSCVTAEPVIELASNSTEVNFSPKVVADGKCIKDVFMAIDSLTSSGKASCSKDIEMVGGRRSSSRDDRLHWDLNVVMDAWEEPLEDSNAHNYVLHDVSQDDMNDKHDSHDKRTTACAEQISSGGMKSKQDGTVRHNVDHHVHLGEKSGFSDTNSNLDVLKCIVDETKSLDCQTMYSTDGLVTTALDHATQTSSSRDLNEADSTVVKIRNLNRCHHNEQDLEGFHSRVFVPSTKVENLSTACASDATTSSETHVTSTACELHVASSIKVQEMSNIQGGNVEHNSAIKIEFSEVPPVSPKESCDPNLGETSKPNLSRCLNYFERDHIEEHTKYNDDVSVRHDMAVAGTDAACSILEDYDSQYEDGELRDSTELAWEKYDDVDREYEQVDYGSSDIGTCITNPSDHNNSESGQVDHHDMAVTSLVDCFVDNEVCNQAPKAIEDDEGLSAADKVEVSRGTEQLESSKSSLDMATRVTDDDCRKDRLPRVVELAVSKGIETREEPKVFRRALQSRIEGLISRDGISRDERPYKTETSFESGSTRSFERGRYSYHNRGRGRQNGRWDGPSDYRRDYKRHYSPINYRRSKLDDDAAMESDDIGCDGSRDDEEPCHGLQSHYRPDRKFSPDRGAGFRRGRPFRYGPLNDSRAGRGRGRYDGPSTDESFQSLLKYRHPLSRREKSLSPFGGRGHSRGKSPSQCRSRSPVVWNSPREGPVSGRGGRTFIRHRSRSPNFSPEVRMQRLRSPNQQPGGFRSITRTHSSPPRNRWNSGRKDDMEQFGNFRSPGRFRSRGDRDSIIDSPRNLNPDGYRRFPDRISEDGTGRGHRPADTYEERRKPYTFLRPARRSYEGEMGSRLHHDMDDGFSNTNNYRNRDAPRFHGRGGFRGIDNINGGMPRKFRGEQQGFVYERDRKFNSNSKEFTADMDGPNQGHRYNNFENRRKQYSSTNFMQRDDKEGLEETSNHDANENFQEAPTRLSEDRDLAASEKEEKPDDISQLVGMQNTEMMQ